MIEIRKECKAHKKSSEWRDPGLINKEFHNYPAFQPDIVDGWKALRINMPERTYERFPTSKQMKFPLVNRDLIYTYDPQNHPEEYNKFLKTHTKAFNVKMPFYINIFHINIGFC